MQGTTLVAEEGRWQGQGEKKKKSAVPFGLVVKDIAIVTAATWVITVAWIIAVAQV